MAEDRRSIYRTNGAAAYDIYSLPEFDSNAARKVKPAQLPHEHNKAQREKSVKAKIQVTPFTVVGIAAVVLAAVMVMLGYVRLYEAKNLSGELNSKLTAVKTENVRLRAQYDNIVGYDDVALYATSHGMRQPTSNQTVYVSVPQKDVAVIETYQKQGLLSQAWDTFRDGFKSVVEYLF
ncbi:MAG: hypothetical protein MJ085_00755 [Clostridia bacterium]|nr:hypothetical protein [Clostridia bacterium]